MTTSPLVTAWSWSRYKAHKDCPFAFKCDVIDHLPRGPQTPAMERGETVHLIAEKYGKGKKPKAVPYQLAKFEKQFKEITQLDPIIETGWGFRRDWSYINRDTWYGDDVWLRVKTDVSILYSDNTADIIDHKTGKIYDDNADQVDLFALAGFMRFPKLMHITARLWYLDSGDEIIREYDVRQAPGMMKLWERKIRPMFADRRFPPRPSWRCKNCIYSKAHGGPCQY